MRANSAESSLRFFKEALDKEQRGAVTEVEEWGIMPGRAAVRLRMKGGKDI